MEDAKKLEELRKEIAAIKTRLNADVSSVGPPALNTKLELLKDAVITIADELEKLALSTYEKK